MAMRAGDSTAAPRGVVLRGALLGRSSSAVVLAAQGRLIEVPMPSIVSISGPADAAEVVLSRDARLVVRDSGPSPLGLTGSDVFGRAQPEDWIAECYSACNCNCNCSSGGGNCNCNCNCSSAPRAEQAAQRSRFRQSLSPVD